MRERHGRSVVKLVVRDERESLRDEVEGYGGVGGMGAKGIKSEQSSADVMRSYPRASFASARIVIINRLAKACVAQDWHFQRESGATKKPRAPQDVDQREFELSRSGQRPQRRSIRVAARQQASAS